MREMQFTGFILMSLMTVALILLLPGKITRDRVANRSRWLIASAMGILGIQFLVQYIFGFRERGIVQAVMVNISFFIPCSWLFSLGVLNIQRRGQIDGFNLWGGVPTWLLTMTILVIAILTDNHPVMAESSRLLWAEFAASAIYSIMQVYYSYLHLKEIVRMESALDNYYDYSQKRMLSWMRLSTISLSMMAIFVPILIFSHGWILRIYCGFSFVTIFATWFSFSRYVISSEWKHVIEAEQSETEEQQETSQAQAPDRHPLSEEARARSEKAVQKWISAKGYLRQGITSPEAAKEMQLPRYLLTAWVQKAGYSSFSNWLTILRIDCAKELLREHPTWTNETIADHCGISRTHFHRVFKESVGLSPAEFQEQQ